MTGRELGGLKVAGIGAAILLTVAAGATGGHLLLPRDTAVAAPSQPTGLPACATEDDRGPCYWDAEHRGNRQGRSFVVLNGQVLYLEPVPQRMPLTRWRANLKAEGFTKAPADAEPGHGECWSVAPDGDTAVIVCRDGYAATS